ncbi:MAG: nitroreductase family protein [Candidatus Omnitrophota bacterium]
METFQAIKSRRSIRKFSSKPIPKETILKLLDAARLAPTARNVQPWEFIVVTDTKIRTTIASFTVNGPFIKDAPVCVLIISKDTKYYLEDGCAATVNILLAAADLGIGACWVAGDKKDYCQKVLSLFKVPDGYKLVSMVALGVAAEKPDVTKKELDDLVHWGTF